MGYSVNGELPDLAGLPDEIEEWAERRSPRTFADYVTLVNSDPSAQGHAESLAEHLRTSLAGIADGGRLLVVSHGGVIELSAVGALGGATAVWGPTLEPLDGVELRLDAPGWKDGIVLRHGRVFPRT